MGWLQGNYLKANCGIDQDGNGNFTIAIQAHALGKWIDTNGAAQPWNAVSSACVGGLGARG